VLALLASHASNNGRYTALFIGGLARRLQLTRAWNIIATSQMQKQPPTGMCRRCTEQAQ
jgi:hypothetical protein